MPSQTNVFTTIRTEGALLPPDLLQRISDGTTLEGLTPESYHRSGEKLNEVINRSWNVLQGAWANFKSGQAQLPESDLATSLTRERWLLPLFRELDYGRLQTTNAVEIGGRSYPISHAWKHVPIHLISYKVELDRRTQGVAGASSASPHSMMQVFLNRSQDNLWGILSNGYKLRILRDNLTLTRQAYVEFDLEAMMEGEIYSDFVLLWLLCHQSRFEGERPSDCWLEKWMKVAKDEGTRALDQLRNGVEEAITALGTGLLEHTANADLRDKLREGRLRGQDYYRQLLRLVYRLLFLFVAEDRDLLLSRTASPEARMTYNSYYGTQRLRRMAETFKGTHHTDLFESLRLVMRLLSGDAHAQSSPDQATLLGLVPLGSFLFSESAVADIITCQISNQHLLMALRALSLTYDQAAGVYRTVDYKHLGPEELGSVYESLLELHPQMNVDARRFILATASGNERKTTGSYYTPTSLINALLDSALEPILAQAMRKGEDAVLALKVCDPACGSGHFLIAAANRIAKALAVVRTSEEEPTPEAIEQARRDVISHCIYGVDINPMAVELCKVNLWMEALEPGKPLTFLDHRIQVGNSLMGATPALMADGIPDDAFVAIEGDDPKYVAQMKKVNKEERKQRAANVRQLGLFDDAPPADYGYLTSAMHALSAVSDDTLESVRHKEAQYLALANDPEYIKARLLADAWCSAFVWKKAQNGGQLPMSDALYRRLQADPFAESLQSVRQRVAELSDRYSFFHWHVAFPDVFSVVAGAPSGTDAGKPADKGDKGQEKSAKMGWQGGFDVVLGNPPWERIKIQEKEWFAERAPEIANAPNAAARQRMIAELRTSNPYLLQAFAEDKRKAEGESHFVRSSARFPLCGRGDVNTYPLFSEAARHIVNARGRVGIIVPSGIATDDTTKFFFQDLLRTRSLISLYDFENREGIFPAVASRMKFCLLTLRDGVAQGVPSDAQAEFVFFAHSVADLHDDGRRFRLSADEIALLNPNTGTMATFRSVRDADITKGIYRRVPVLVQEVPLVNPWGVSFLRMFDMSNDSHLFRTREELETRGFALVGNHFVHQEGRYLPLYEAKMIHQFTHRWATYTTPAASASKGASARRKNVPSPDDDGQASDGLSTRAMTADELRDPHALPLPRYWVDERDVMARLDAWDRGWLLGFRSIARSTDERTTIFGLTPLVAYGNSLPLLQIQANNTYLITTNASTFAFDFVTRQKVCGSNFNFFIVQQLPVIPPHTYTPVLLDFIAPRVLELTYTAWDLQAFAQDMGYEGAPFVWDEERRFLMRCELDALYFHLYQIARDDVDYIMETFPIVRRKDEATHGEYRTKRVILAMYDQMASLPVMLVPTPKDAGVTYAVPDVRQWQTWLTPAPADAQMAHRR